MLPKDHKVKENSTGNEIQLPYKKFIKDMEEEESFKVLSELVIHNMGSGYTCFVQAYAFFISTDREVKISKSPIVKLFDDVNSIDKFLALGLPIKKEHKCPDGTNNFAYEIDLNQTRQLQKALGNKKLDCLPILWVFSNPSYTEWSVRFEQRFAVKFLVLKLIDSLKNSTYDNNIDMYNLTMNGHPLLLPTISSSI